MRVPTSPSAPPSTFNASSDISPSSPSTGRSPSRVVDFSLAEERAARRGEAVTVSVPLCEFPPWTPFLVSGDLQNTRLVPGGPERSLHSSLVCEWCGSEA